jgi:hypothetical protein
MGYVFAFAPCLRCGLSFGFNPCRVPSLSVEGAPREPVCEECMYSLNLTREALGLEKWVIPEGAYEPGPEEELL